MKKILFGMVTSLVLLFLLVTPAMADTKIAVINLQQLLQQLPQMKQASNNLKNQFDEREKKIVAAENDFKKGADDYKRNGAVMSVKDRQSAEGKLMKQRQDLQSMQGQFQQDFQTAQNKAIDDILSKMKIVVEKIATDNKFNLVLVNASVAYADKDLDITDQVLKKMS